MLKPIKTEELYNDALMRVYQLMQKDIEQGSAESDELEILSMLVKEFEAEHYPISAIAQENQKFYRAKGN